MNEHTQHPQRTHNWINGEPQEPSDGAYLEKFSPATGERLGETPDSDLLDVVRAVQAANKASADWQKSTLETRAWLFERVADALAERTEEFARLDMIEQGLPIRRARECVARAVAVFRFYARFSLGSASIPARLSGENFTLSNRLPGGVAGIFLPWSQPLLSAAYKIAPALASGCAVIAKPSRHASTSTLRLAELMSAVGFAPGVCNVVCGTGAKVGEAIAGHPGIPLVSLTGRTSTGRNLLRTSAEAFKRVQLSLGGRNAVLVFNDVELEKVMPDIVRFCFEFQTETAFRGSRLFVQETIYKKFLDLFRAETEKLKVGRPDDESTVIGPLVSPELYDAFVAACAQAGAEKGKALFDAADRDGAGLFAPPAAFVDLTLCSTLQQEEVLGPFVTISSFKYQHEALKHANTSPLGQSAYVYTASLSRAAKVALKLEAGRVFVNSGPKRDLSLSAGGLKASGLGGDGAPDLCDFFSRRSSVYFG